MNSLKYFVISTGMMLILSGGSIVLAEEIESVPDTDTSYLYQENESEVLDAVISADKLQEMDSSSTELNIAQADNIQSDSVNASQSATASENQGWVLTETQTSSNYQYRNENGEYVNGFTTIDGKDYYFDSKGMVSNKAVTIDGTVYIFNNDGSYSVAKEGWNDNGLNKYYVQNGNLLTNSILDDCTNQYLFDDAGCQVFNSVISVTDSDTTYYSGADSDGHIVKNQFFQGYYFDSEGHPASQGFITVDGSQYYIVSNGKYLSNTISKIDGTYYMFDITGCASKLTDGITTNINTYYVVDGERASGIYEIDGKEYYFNYGVMLKNQTHFVSSSWVGPRPDDFKYDYIAASEDGSLLKNQWFTGPYERLYGSYSVWINTTVYAGADGYLVEGLQTISGKQYYFDNHSLVTNTIEKINDEYYACQENGECIPIRTDGWVNAGKRTYYFENGKPVDGVYTIGGDDYYFDEYSYYLKENYPGRINLNEKYISCVTDSSGKIAKNKWTRIETGDRFDGDYYSTEDGSVLVGFQTVDGKNMYFDSTGRKYASEIREINHQLYKFDEDGSYITNVNDGFYYGAYGVQWVKNGSLVRNCMITYNNNNYVLNGYGDCRRLHTSNRSYDVVLFMNSGSENVRVYPTAFTGELLKSDFIKNDNGSDYYADENSVLRYGLIEHNGEKYVIAKYLVFREDYETYLVRNTPLSIKGVHYYADENGLLHETVKKSGHTLSLEGNIGVNFYLDFADYVLANEGAKLELSVDGKNISYNVKDAVKQNNYRKFAAEVTSAQMATDIAAKLILSDGTVVYTEKYSVKQYCDNMLAKTSTNDTLRNLLESLLNYGGYAQMYFKYNTEHLANENLTNTDVSDVTADTLSVYNSKKTGSEPGLTFKGSTLVLESLTAIRHYFTVGNGHTISDYIFKVNGETVTPIASGDRYYVEIPNIASGDLDEMFTVKVGGFTVKYSALSYAFNRVNNTSDEEALQNVCRALYKYNQAANAYFSKS